MRWTARTITGQHKPESGEQATEAAAGTGTEVHAEFMRFGAGKDLVNGEHPVEVLGRYPSLLVHQLAADHRDLRHWPPHANAPNDRKRRKMRP